MWTVGSYPFRAKKKVDVLKKIRYGEFKLHKKYWKGISEDAKSLLKQMMNVDPGERDTAVDALSSSWIH